MVINLEIRRYDYHDTKISLFIFLALATEILNDVYGIAEAKHYECGGKTDHCALRGHLPPQSGASPRSFVWGTDS